MTERQFAIAYDAGFPRTVRYLCSTGLSADMAEEIAQAAWARGWECRTQLKSAGAIHVWVTTIAKNMVRLAIRKQWRTEELSEIAVSAPSTPFALQVGELLRRCPESDQALLVQHYVLGYSSTELAPQLGIHPVSVRVRLLRIKAALREAVERPAAAGQFIPSRDTESGGRGGPRGGIPNQHGSPTSAGGLDTDRQK